DWSSDVCSADLFGLTHEQGGHCRYEGERKNECADQRQHERCRHGLEGLTFHALQGEDGGKYQQDDDLTECGWANHLARSLSGHVQPLDRRQDATQFGTSLTEH